MHALAGGIVACDIFLIGGVAMCDKGREGSNLVKKSVTYFLNGPFQFASFDRRRDLIHHHFVVYLHKYRKYMAVAGQKHEQDRKAQRATTTDTKNRQEAKLSLG